MAQKRSLATLFLSVLLMLGFIPAPAHADTVRSATGQGWALDPGAASTNAQNAARASLASLASSLGEVCSNVTSSGYLIYQVPSGGGYQYGATATGTCAAAPPPPSYTVPRTATRRGDASTYTAAIASGEAQARGAILAAGVNCINFQTTAVTLFYQAPLGSWYYYDVTVRADCVQ